MGKTRLFNLEWDNSKMPRLDYEFRMQKRNSEGVHFANGVVVLDIGVVYDNMDQLEHNLKNYGNVEIAYQDEQETANAQAS